LVLGAKNEVDRFDLAQSAEAAAGAVVESGDEEEESEEESEEDAEDRDEEEDEEEDECALPTSPHSLFSSKGPAVTNIGEVTFFGCAMHGSWPVEKGFRSAL
jgi:hypothetical protein